MFFFSDSDTIVKKTAKMMATNMTKALAARVPLDEYIRVITAAMEFKLSVSDYIIMKLNTPDKVESLQVELATAKSELAQLREKLNKTKKDVSATPPVLGKLDESKLQELAKLKGDLLHVYDAIEVLHSEYRNDPVSKSTGYKSLVSFWKSRPQ